MNKLPFSYDKDFSENLKGFEDLDYKLDTADEITDSLVNEVFYARLYLNLCIPYCANTDLLIKAKCFIDIFSVFLEKSAVRVDRNTLTYLDYIKNFDYKSYFNNVCISRHYKQVNGKFNIIKSYISQKFPFFFCIFLLFYCYYSMTYLFEIEKYFCFVVVIAVLLVCFDLFGFVFNLYDYPLYILCFNKTFGYYNGKLYSYDYCNDMNIYIRNSIWLESILNNSIEFGVHNHSSFHDGVVKAHLIEEVYDKNCLWYKRNNIHIEVLRDIYENKMLDGSFK